MAGSGLQAAQFMGQSPTLLVFYRQLICISYASWVMQKERVIPSAPAFTSHNPTQFLFILPSLGHSITQAELSRSSNTETVYL